MRASQSLALSFVLACFGLPALAQGPISNLPRNQTLIVEDPEGTIKNAGWFNIWAVNAGGQSTGLHQLAVHGGGWRCEPRGRRRERDGERDNELGEAAWTPSQPPDGRSVRVNVRSLRQFGKPGALKTEQ